MTLVAGLADAETKDSGRAGGSKGNRTVPIMHPYCKLIPWTDGSVAFAWY